MPAPETLSGFSDGIGLATIGVVILTCIRNGKETVEARYFISSLALGVKQFARGFETIGELKTVVTGASMSRTASTNHGLVGSSRGKTWRGSTGSHSRCSSSIQASKAWS